MNKYEEELKKQNERIKWIIGGLYFEDLTEWEQEFIQSVEIQSDNKKLLSDKQMAIAERIYREKGT